MKNKPTLFNVSGVDWTPLERHLELETLRKLTVVKKNVKNKSKKQSI